MTIITESLISEYPNQKVFHINDIINKAIIKTASSAVEYNIEFNIDNADIKKLLITNLVIEVCEFKKINNNVDIAFIFNEAEYEHKMLLFVKAIFCKMEIFKKEKSNSFFRSFLKFIKQNELTYLANTYLKQATNKLALVK
jgi:hypothetical protein